MMIHDITAQAGKHKRRKRVGRGIGSGLGKTCGKGHKGAKSRAGYSRKMGHEGGQTPFFMRIRRVGFTNFDFRKNFECINLKELEARFDDGAEVNPDMLVKVGLLSDASQPVKILGEGELTRKLTVTASKFSASAKEKIEKAGGSATVAE